MADREEEPQDQRMPTGEKDGSKEINQLESVNSSLTRQGHAAEDTPQWPGTEERIRGLARAFSNPSRASRQGPNEVNPFDVTNDPSLDPNSSKFNVAHWLSVYLSVISQDSEKYPQRTIGISYRDLHVYGFDGGSDYQKDVLNVLIHATNLLLEPFREKRKIPILREFDGLIRQGEMCVVLGRPGR
jgi:ATP-binding cassette subfamily G (WHITE) protein 2 (PDR)